MGFQVYKMLISFMKTSLSTKKIEQATEIAPRLQKVTPAAPAGCFNFVVIICSISFILILSQLLVFPNIDIVPIFRQLQSGRTHSS